MWANWAAINFIPIKRTHAGVWAGCPSMAPRFIGKTAKKDSLAHAYILLA